MKYIAIIAAEDKEVFAIRNIMTDISEKNIYDIKVLCGKINNISCIVSQSGVGKVNAGRTAQILIDKFDVFAVINTGSAGALDESLKIGDVIISSELVQHDFDVTAFGREMGFIPGVGKTFPADSRLVEICEAELNKKDISFKKGIIATGDKFLSNRDIKTTVGGNFNALCAEMEGAAVAQVCKLCDVPFIIIRSISDELNGNAKIDFDEFLEVASKKCADIIYDIVDKF